MPSWLKKRFQVLKNDLINHIIVAKNQKQMLLTRAPPVAICDNSNNNTNSNNNNERITNSSNSKKVRIRRIRNDLHTNRFSSKTDMNAYNDYTKWRDQVLINQNNCALRCIKQQPDEVVEEKIINTDKIDSTPTHCPNGANASQNNNYRRDNSLVCTFDSRQMRCDNRAVAMAVASSNNNVDDDGGGGGGGSTQSGCDGNDDAICDNESEFMNSTNAVWFVSVCVCVRINIQSKDSRFDKRNALLRRFQF